MKEKSSISVSKIIVGALPLLMIAAVIFLNWPSNKHGSTEIVENLGFYELPEPTRPATVALRDLDGSVTSLPRDTGVPTILFFGFTSCPDVCPTTLSVLNLAVENLASPPRVIMVSVDPARDSVERLRQYVRAFNPAFEALTGEISDIRRLADSVGVGFIRGPTTADGNYSVDHSGALVVLNECGEHIGSIHPPLHPERLSRLFRTGNLGGCG